MKKNISPVTVSIAAETSILVSGKSKGVDGRDDGRDGHDSVNLSLFLNNARYIFNKATLFVRCTKSNFPLVGTIYSHLGNKLFPVWEQYIPALGTIA